MQPNHITTFHGLQGPNGCLRHGSWCPAPPSGSPDPLSSLCRIFVPHLLFSYLICNSFLFSDGCLGISWFKFTSPVKNHFTDWFLLHSFIFIFIFIFLVYLSGMVTLQSLSKNRGDRRCPHLDFTEMLLVFAGWVGGWPGSWDRYILPRASQILPLFY